jgi:hypothetical protein
MAIIKFVGGPLDGLVYPPSLDPAAPAPADNATVIATNPAQAAQMTVPSGRGTGDQLWLLSKGALTSTTYTYHTASGNFS